MAQDDIPQPPSPPEVEKKLQLHRVQWIGIPLLLLIPLLALLGLFGETFEQLSDANDTLAVEVQYATRYRYKMINDVRITVQNLSASTIPTLTVALDAGYVAGFSTVAFSPSLDQISNGRYQVHLTDVQPNETRLVVVELQAERYWQHTGRITISAPDVPPVALPLSTFIFP